ncbi:MAG: NUDIX hydrolase [Pseudomonadales bacterium]|jgi:8-oxo-dGTP pyrophosphatase MutT (NUDIX family)
MTVNDELEPLLRGNIRMAASLLLVRDRPGGPEVFMLKRPGGVDFPDLHVFPGGKLDLSDHQPALLEGLSEWDADRALGVSGGSRYWVAAIRECFEECGVLLASRDDGLIRLESDSERARFHDYRQALIDRRLDIGTLCAREGLRLAGDRVQYFSHWITPEQAPRRFDTRFFIAAMPDEQDTLAHHWETAGEEWVRPADALSAHRAGRLLMISPTLITLESLAACQSVSSMMSAVAAEAHLPPLTRALQDQGMHTLR